jgi:hypothetical protein
MALNLVRNSKVYFTTNLDTAANGYQVKTSGFTAANTFEIQVLDGLSFSQNSNSDTVTVAEAGSAPVRGQRAFNTSLAPVDFSFSNYIRPFNTGSAVTAEESVLWNALLTDQDISTANTVTLGGTITGVTYTFANGTGTVTFAGTSLTYVGVAAGDTVVISGLAGAPASDLVFLNAPGVVVGTPSTTSIVIELTNPKAGTITSITTPGTVKLFRSAWAPVSSSYSVITAAGSNKHQLQKFGLLILVDQVVYAIDNCALGQVSIDFGLDAIATAAWTGQGTTLRQIAVGATATGGTFGGGTIAGNYTQKITNAAYITNKLSTVSLSLVNGLKNAAGTTVSAAGTSYTVALTGGNITVNNNVTYITPANLGVVNTPVTYYTGTRAISGSLNAYLKTGTGVGGTGQLLSDMLSAAAGSVEPMAALSIAVGGGNNTIKMVLDMPATVLSIPTIDVQQIVSTAINFTAQGMTPSSTADGNVYDLSETNDITIRYYS